MDPQSKMVLYPSNSERLDIINHWLRQIGLLNTTPHEIISSCSVFATNPYQNRFQFNIGEVIGYIKSQNNYIVNITIQQCIIGCRIQVNMDRNKNTFLNEPNKEFWIELPSPNIVPPLPFPFDNHKTEASKDIEEEEIGLDDLGEEVPLKSFEDNSVVFDVPSSFVEISKWAGTILEDDYIFFFEFKVSVDHLSLIVKYMFHCKGKEIKYNVDAECIQKYRSIKDIIDNEWILQFLDMVDCMKDGMVGFLKAVDYMDITILMRLCVFWILFSLKDKGESKQKIVDYFERNGIANLLHICVDADYYNTDGDAMKMIEFIDKLYDD